MVESVFRIAGNLNNGVKKLQKGSLIRDIKEHEKIYGKSAF